MQALLSQLDCWALVRFRRLRQLKALIAARPGQKKIRLAGRADQADDLSTLSSENFPTGAGAEQCGARLGAHT